MSQQTMSAWQQRARRVLAGGVSSQFRAPDPPVFTCGAGSRVWDADGRRYIDYTLSQGPLIHGHSRAAILERLAAALQDGQVWNGLHRLEIELAEKLVELIPCAERVRLGCTGSEAVQAALRLARAYTGRKRIVKFEGHYHGWLDSVAGSINPPLDQAGPDDHPQCVPWTDGLASGSLDDLIILPWNDLEGVERVVREQGDQIAAVITEPCMCNAGCIEPQPGYLAGLRRLCDSAGIVLVFDEVITGFRLALGGAQQYYGVVPDLAVFGKAVAGGFPLSVLAGREPIMELLAAGRVVQAGTLNAHVGSVAAALASVELLEAAGGRAYKELYQFGRLLRAGLEQAAAEAGRAVAITGPGPVLHMGFLRPGADRSVACYRDVLRTYEADKYARFVRLMAQRGVRLIGRGIWYISTAHTEADLDQTLGAAREALRQLD